MNPADKRVTELLDKWLTSLELHLKYAALGDADYAAVQPWPKHDRPTRWIIELARQKTLELQSHLEARLAMGDGKFSDALELTVFLANLVGSQHVQRFIPLAETDKEQKIAPPPQKPIPSKSQPDPAPADRTREMPRLQAAAPARKNTEAPAPVKPAAPPRSAPKAAKKAAPAATPAGKSTTGPALQKKIMADAVRLLKWGKEWHELADLIARIADRPPAAEIRRILRSHKAEIEMQAEGDD